MAQTYTCLGLRPYSMKAQDTGALIEGVTVFSSFKDEHINGEGTDKFSITNAKLGNLPIAVGKKFVPEYNRYGKVVSICLM